jgi:hypothetical protein
VLLRRISLFTAFGLIVLASVCVVLLTARNPAPLKPIFYLWVCIPILIGGLTLIRPNRVDLAALLLIVYIFCPYSLSIGIFYIPGAIVMTTAAIAKWFNKSRLRSR